jgi:hypothetical protein
VAGEGGLVFEPGDSGGFPDELGRGQLTAAGQRQQRRGDKTHPVADPGGQGVDLFGQAGDVGQFVAGQFGDQAGLGGQPCPEQLAMFGTIERAGFGGMGGIELMNPPQQPVDRRSALPDKIFTTIHQQLQFPGDLVVRGDREVGFTQHRPRDSQRIDGIRLAPGAR